MNIIKVQVNFKEIKMVFDGGKNSPDSGNTKNDNIFESGRCQVESKKLLNSHL